MERRHNSPSNHDVIRKCLSGRDYQATFSERAVSNTMACGNDLVAPQHVVLNLMLSSLSDPLLGEYDISNVGGSLYVVSPIHFEQAKGLKDRVPADVVPCIHALKVWVLPDLAVKLSVATFTSSAVREYPAELSRYELVDGRHLRRVAEVQDKADPRLYVNRAPYRNVRYGKFDFLDASDWVPFSSSKVGILYSMLQILGEEYCDVVSIGFESVPASKWNASPLSAKKAKNALLQRLARRLADRIVSVSFDVDIPSDARSQVLACLQDILPATEIRESPLLDPIGLNIRVIHERGYYEQHGDDDPYLGDGGSCCQHITFETLFGKGTSPRSRRGLLEVVVKELAIKADLMEGKFLNVVPDDVKVSLTFASTTTYRVRLYDSSNLSSKESEDSRDKDESARKKKCLIKKSFRFHTVMHVELDGSFWFEGPYSTALLPDSDDVEYLVEELDADPQAEYAFMDSWGNVNVAKRTELYGMPNLISLVRDLRTKPKEMDKFGTNISRGPRGRSLYFNNTVDMYLSTISAGKGGYGYYQVGLRGKGMQFSATHRASIVREVHATTDSDLLLNQLLPLLDVDFIRPGEMTVTPFPLKYLREWTMGLHLDEIVKAKLDESFTKGYEIESLTVTY